MHPFLIHDFFGFPIRAYGAFVRALVAVAPQWS